MKLSILQMTLGAVVAVADYLIITQSFPLETTVTGTEAGSFAKTFINPGPQFIWSERLANLTLLLGLAVTGCGLAQLLKARRAR